MAPAVVGLGAVTSSASAITPAFPAGIIAGHIILIVAECEGITSPGVYTPPSGWAHVTGSPVQQSTNTRLTVLWARYDGVMTASSIGDAGDHNIGRTIAFSGCATVGNPWDVVSSAVDSLSTTSCLWPGVTTSTADTLICEIVSTGTDTSTSQMGTLSNANYTGITTRINNWTLTGNGGGIGLVTGVKATTGATGQSAMALVSASTKALMTLALRPVPGGGPPGVLQRSPRPIESAQPYGSYAPQTPSMILQGG